MHDFVRQLIRYRKANLHAFAPREYGLAFAWKNAQNGDLMDWGRRHLMQHYYDETAGHQIVVLLNMEVAETVEFRLPEGVAWQRVLDTQSHFDTPGFLDERAATVSHNITLDAPEPITGGTYGVTPRSVVVLESL
jgi:hypothetical protein